MSDQPEPTKRSTRARGSAPAWLRLATVCVVLIVVPVGLYLFLYQRSRIEDATIRNFRALDDAARRVDQVLTRLSSVVNGSSFGMSPLLLEEVTQRLTGRTTACGPGRAVEGLDWDKPTEPSRDRLPSRRATAAQRLEFRYWLAAHTLFHGNKNDHGATRRLWDQLHCLIDTHRRYSEPDEPIEVEVSPSPRIPLRPAGARCVNMPSDAACVRLRDLLAAESCLESAPSPRLNPASGGMGATIVDCRRLRERHRDLYDALKPFHGSEAVIEAIDLFAIRSTAQLDGLIQEATGYLSRFFDSHLIADGDGQILFQANAALTSGTEADESQVATPAFSSHVDISELLRVESTPSDPAGDGGASSGNRGPAASVPLFRGRSFVQVVGVEDVDLRVFVHPFVLDSIDVPEDSRPAPDQGRAARSGSSRPTFYLVGIVDDSEFGSAAIKLRLALVVDATLALLVLLTLAPLLWLWTAGDRLAVRRLALTGVCVTPVVGVALLTVLACGMVTNRIDGHALDDAMAHLSDRIAELFDRELRAEIHDLRRQVPRLLARAANADPPRPPRERMHLWRTIDLDGKSLTRLERRLYCDDSDRDVDYDPRDPEIQGAFLLNEEGRQQECLGGTRVARNPKLDLAFREYFQGPKTGALWQPPPSARSLPVSCRVREVQDEESLIPCLVDGLPEPSKRSFHLPGTSGSSAGLADVPYFLERIDSVVGGRVETILAVGTGRSKTPVAATAVPLYSLDRAVPPQHFDFAVVDRETGRTLFHSDDELAMTTNFAEDTGGDPALWSLLRSRAHDTTGLAYAGAPIRAHVRPLREGMPWTLIVYRGHELEDRLTTVTHALAIFSSLVWPFLLAGLAGLLLLLKHWCRPGTLAGVPLTLGRVMATGFRFRRPFSAVMGIVLVSLLCGPWFGWHSSPAANPWIPWNPWSPDSGWSPWRGFPFFARCSVIAVFSFLACCVLGLHRPTNAAAYGARTLPRTLVLVVVLVGLAIVPPALWFGHHRAELGVGLNHYLVDRTLESVARAREDHRRERLREHGAAAAPAGDRTRHRLHAEPEPDETWVGRTLRAVVASSRLSNELLIYRALPPAAADGVASLYGVFDRTFGYDVHWPLSGPGVGRFVPLSVALSVVMVLLVLTVAYSVCALCTIVRRSRHCMMPLPDADAIPKGTGKRGSVPAKPLRVIVLCASGRDRDRFVRRLTRRLDLAPHRYHVVRQDDGYTRDRVDWVTKAAKTDPPLYIFDDLERVLDDTAEGRALFKELERKVDGSSGVLVCSRVVPDYRYSHRFGPAHRRFAGGNGHDGTRQGRWASLAPEFRPYRLGFPDRRRRRFDRMFTGRRSLKPLGEIEEAMWKEVLTHPDLSLLARNVLANARRELPPPPLNDRDACALAFTAFRKSAASCFNRIWTESTYDERLQLYAVANRGVVDSRRTAALSSLVNRGIVEEDGDTGVVRLRSDAFAEFVEHDVDHGELDAWRKEGDGGAWRFIWPPLAIGATLSLAFLALANPEMRTTLLTTLLGLAPAALPFLRGGQSPGAPPT